MRAWCYPCLLAFGLLIPRPCLAQAALDDPRAEQELQEDVEVLRRIVTESVQKVYQQADERVTRTCAHCHAIQAPLVGMMFAKGLSRTSDDGVAGAWWDAIDGHALQRIHQPGPTDATRVSGLANYVPGHGIVVQMEAPAPVVDRDVKPFVEADEAAPKRWEVLLREMRGDAQKSPPLKPLVLSPQHRRVHRLILTEKVVELLAENGRNLRRLTPEEHVTIAFTFRTPTREQREAERATLLRHYFPSASSETTGAGMGAVVGGGMSSGGGMAGAVGANRSGPAGSGTGSRPLGGAPALGPTPMALDELASVRTSAVAGDLLLRQERYAEAIAAYEKALKESGVNLADQKTPLSADAADVVRKLVQAHVGAKNVSQATTLLQWLERSQASSSDETTALRRIYLDLMGILPTPEEVKTYLNDTRSNRRELLLDRLLINAQEDDRPSRVPARMTVSCTRKQLDDVAEGKLTKLDFASKVSLKYYKTSAPAGKKDAVKKD